MDQGIVDASVTQPETYIVLQIFYSRYKLYLIVGLKLSYRFRLYERNADPLYLSTGLK